MAGEAPTNPERADLRVGSYRLLRSLGSGGMSSVFRAEHVDTGLEVAVKVLPRTLARNKTLLQRFLREAKSAEALEHPNIVAIYDRGSDQGRYYLVLEYVSGGDLHDWVRANGPMPITDAVAVIRSVAEGLKFAAERGLIHRDIKPANLLMTTDGRVKIADLGLALQAEEEDERVTREGTTVGTVDYMAPEQARDSRATSIRSDIYSLGCTFFFLLTGQPPFPGGDVADKLTRHCTAKPPEIAAFRPDAPPALDRLIHKMLAKRPEKRFADYDELITALDAVLGGDKADLAADGPAPLYAILDDEDDGPGLVSDDFLPLSLPGPARAASPGPVATPADAISMAELAELDDGGEPGRVGRRPAPRPPAVAARPEDVDAPPAAHRLFEEDDAAAMEVLPGHHPVPGRRMTEAEKSWLTRCIVLGVALVLFVIGADVLIRSTSTPAEPLRRTADGADGGPELAPAREPEQPLPGPPAVAALTRPLPISRPAPKATAKPAPAPRPTEPVDTPPESIPEAAYAADLEARFRPAWAAAEVATRLPGRSSTVRRVVDPRDPDQKPSIQAGLDVAGGGTVEVADNGPFYEDDLRVVGDARAVRARPGFRPMVVLEHPRLDAIKQLPAPIDVDARSLTLDGLDLVFDTRVLAPNQTAFLRCRGGRLTLRNCTVTVINRSGRPVALVQAAASDRTAQIRLENTFIRGSFATVVELAGGAADVVLGRSVVLNGQGSIVSSAGPGLGERRLFVIRSVVVTRGPAFESSDVPGGRPRVLEVRSLGSTFAHVASAEPAPLVLARGSGSAGELLSWEGAANTFDGWSAWLTAGSPPGVRVRDLAAARSVWPASDRDSRESPRGWPLVAPFETISLTRLREVVPDRRDVLARVAAPSPFLFEKTVDAFGPPIDPGYTPPRVASVAAPPSPTIDDGMAPGGSGPNAKVGASRRPDIAGGPGNRPAPGARTTGSPGVRELDFSTTWAEWAGDLGRFVAAAVKPADRLVRVTASGFGNHPFSRLVLPEGVGLEVVVAADTGGQFPTWFAPRGTSGEGLIDIRGASVRLTGFVASRDGSARLKSLIRVERGHLVVHRGRLTATGPAEPGGGGLIAFHAPGSLPLSSPTWPDPTNAWPFDRPTDRPTCRLTESVLVSAGEAITAAVARGLVEMGQCVVVAGSTAFTLNPRPVARHRFEADLWLDHCTLSAEANFVVLGPWPGAEPGPDRPWLVTTRRCTFFGSFPKPGRDSVLLRAEPEALAHGALLWQTSGDAVEVPVFAAATDAPPPENRRPDVNRQWAEFWGPSHAHAVIGPHSPHGLPGVKPVTRLRSGRVEPGDLYVDPRYPTDSPPPRDLGADLARLGIAPTTWPARRR